MRCKQPVTRLLLSCPLLIAGFVALGEVGCAAPQCETSADCFVDEVCARGNRCVPDPTYDAMRKDPPGSGSGSPVDGGVTTDALTDAAATDAPAGNVCGSETDTFDPNRVYIMGSLNRGDCNSGAIAAVDTPNNESVGFACGVEQITAVLSPKDGRLLYVDKNEDKLFQFARDEHPYNTASDSCDYPEAPAANDTSIPTTGCDALGGPLLILTSPESVDVSDVWYNCSDSETDWFDEAHNPIGLPNSVRPAVRGNSGYALAKPNDGSGAVLANQLTLHDISGNMVATTGLSDIDEVTTARAHIDGFRLVLRNVVSKTLTLWQLDINGDANQVGAYPSIPSDVQITVPNGFLRWKLDANDALYIEVFDKRQGQGGTDNPLAILKLVKDAADSEVIYTEANNPLVETYIGALVTGP